MTAERSAPVNQRLKASLSAESNTFEDVIARVSCRDNSGRPVEIIEYRYTAVSASSRGERRHVGAIGWRTDDGQSVRQIDSDLYEIESSGDLLERVA